MTVKRFKEYLKTPKNNRFFTIAIDGRGASGKSTLRAYLSVILPGFIFIDGDDYFEPSGNTVTWGKFNEERFERDVIHPLALQKVKFAYYPYDWHAQPHIKEEMIDIDKGIGIERCFSFELGLDWDLKIWVEIPKNVALQRGIDRAHAGTKRNREAWAIWQSAEDEYIKRTDPIRKANIVLDGTKAFSDQIIF